MDSINRSPDAGNGTVPVPVLADAMVFAGIDVSKDQLVLARSNRPGKAETFANDPAGIAALVGSLRPLGSRLGCVVVESTGGLERPLLAGLLDADLPAALVHPGRVRHFAKGIGVESKTDAVDAAVLARFAELAKPRLLEKRSANATELRDLVACRRQLAASRAQQLNRRSSTANRAALKSIDAVIAAFDRQVEKLERRIRELLDADDDFKDLGRRLREVPGLGPVAVPALLAELPELGKQDRRRVGALVGVAPFPDDSGPRSGPRHVRGGRVRLRCVLYLCALAAMRFNPVIKDFAARLRATGKRGKVIVVACMRKLVSLLNAMARDGLKWGELSVVKKLAANA